MSVRRLLIAILTFVAAASAADAHWLYDMYKSGDRPYFGVRLNGGYAFPLHVRYARTPVSSKANGYDIAVQGLFHAPIKYGFYAEPQIEAYYSGLKTAGVLSEEVIAENITSATMNNMGFRVPIALGWSCGFTGFRASIFTGPEFDFRLNTSFKPDHPTKIFNSTTARPLYGDYGVDLNLRSGIGFTFGQVYVGAAFVWKMCKITQSDYGAKRQRVALISVGYNFKNL